MTLRRKCPAWWGHRLTYPLSLSQPSHPEGYRRARIYLRRWHLPQPLRARHARLPRGMWTKPWSHFMTAFDSNRWSWVSARVVFRQDSRVNELKQNPQRRQKSCHTHRHTGTHRLNIQSCPPSGTHTHLHTPTHAYTLTYTHAHPATFSYSHAL